MHYPEHPSIPLQKVLDSCHLHVGDWLGIDPETEPAGATVSAGLVVVLRVSPENVGRVVVATSDGEIICFGEPNKKSRKHRESKQRRLIKELFARQPHKMTRSEAQRCLDTTYDGLESIAERANSKLTNELGGMRISFQGGENVALVEA